MRTLHKLPTGLAVNANPSPKHPHQLSFRRVRSRTFVLALALHDRGQEFVVQSPDGRVGVLRDLSGIERA